MIKLKHILLEQNIKQNTDDDIKVDVPTDKTGTIIKGISSSDPWEYYHHDADGMWKTKRRTASKFLDMQKKLIRVYGDNEGSERYETAISRLNVYLDNQRKAEQDGKQVIPVSIPDDKVEISEKPKSPIDDLKPVHVEPDDKMKEVLISVKAKRHPTVYVTGKTDDNKYLEIENPRKIHLHKTVYVLASEFELTSKFFAKYIGTNPRYDLYKLKD
jgi:hypothetical protein